MTVSSVSDVSTMASYASQMQSNRTRANVAQKVLEQVQDQAEVQADALVAMIEDSSQMLEETGQIFDIRA